MTQAGYSFRHFRTKKLIKKQKQQRNTRDESKWMVNMNAITEPMHAMNVCGHALQTIMYYSSKLLFFIIIQ